MSFDLTDLYLFVRVAEEGSITAGADRAHLALPSASARIRAMEQSLGAPLLVRGRRGVQPTQAGRALLTHARIITRQWELMQSDLAEYAKGRKGQVRLLCNTATITEFLPEVLGTFFSQHPNVGIDITERLSAEIVQDVVDGRADIGVVAKGTDVGELETLPFRSLRVVVVTSRDHPLSQVGRGVHLSEVLDHDFIGLAEGSSIQKFLATNAAKLGKWIQYRVRLRSFEAVCSMVEGGAGVGIIPDTAALRCAKTMDIHLVELDEPWAVRQLTICMRSYKDLPPFAKDLVEMIRCTEDGTVARPVGG